MVSYYILGASDPEMAAIERLALDAGQMVVYALAGDGQRVTPAAAYQAAALTAPVPAGVRVVAVECGGSAVDHLVHQRVDHHRPGDPGYGRPPAEFLPASSVGQVWLLTSNHREFVYDDGSWYSSDGYEPRHEAAVPIEIVLTAAADHCLTAAYRGDCPGVDPDDLMAWRVRSRAAFQGRPAADIEADIAAARAALAAAPRVIIAGHEVCDLRGYGTVPELPEAAARDGTPFLATLLERGQKKTVLQAAPAPVVAAWMAGQRAEGRQPYGDPARGFAGVIEPPRGRR